MKKKDTDATTRRRGIGGVRWMYQCGDERRLAASLAPSTAKQGANNRREQQEPERPEQQQRTKN